MKRFYLLSFICAGIILLSLFLPYEATYSSWLSRDPNLFNDHTREINNGWKYLPFTLIPAIVIGLIAGLNAIRENLGTAITGLAVSILNLFYMGFLSFVMTFSIFSNRSKVEIGYYIALIMVVLHILLMIVHLIRVIRHRKNPKHNPMVANDLLDNEF